MAGNTLLTISMITYEAARVLLNNLVFANQISRDYDDQFAVAGAKIGDTINIRKPPRYTVRSGRQINVQDITESYVPLTLDKQRGVDLNWTSADMLLSIDNFSERILKPALAPVANQIDLDGLALYSQVPNAVGTPGTTPNALLTYLLAGAKLSDEAAPQDDDRSIVMNPLAQANIVDALKGLFHSSTEITRQYEKGQMGIAAGFNWYMDQNVAVHTVGALGGTPLVNGASQTGATLVTNGWTAAAAERLKLGDVFTIAGVFAVNPQSRVSTGQLRQFRVTANTSSDASGNMTIPIAPSIITSGAFQTVTASPAHAAALTVLGAASVVSPQNLAFHKSAFALGMADLPMPPGVRGSRVTDDELGISIRVLEGYDIQEDLYIVRLDVLYGYVVIYPELAVRVVG